MKKTLLILLAALLALLFTACAVENTEEPAPPESPRVTSQPAAVPETPEPAPTYEPTPTPEPYVPMDLFGEEFNPFGMEMPDNLTVFAASFNKGAAKLEGKNPFVLSMTGKGNMFACVAYQADAAGLPEEKKQACIKDYLESGFCEFTGADGRVVTIRQASRDDDRYEYVEADGSHGQTGGGCVIDITYDVPDADMEKYTQLVRDIYSIEALQAVTPYFDGNTDFAECSIEVNLYKNTAKTAVTYYVPDVEAIRQSIAANIKSDWWEWYGNQETYLAYNEDIGNKLIFDAAGAITVEQECKKLNGATGDGANSDVSLAKLGFGFDQAGTCGVYEQREPHYVSVAVARPEWGEFPEDWNIEFMDTDVNGYSLRITYHESEGRYHISVDKDGKTCAYDTYPKKNEVGWEYPDLDTVHQMFNDAFGTKEKELYAEPLNYFQRYIQERFGMSIQELYALPKQ